MFFPRKRKRGEDKSVSSQDHPFRNVTFAILQDNYHEIFDVLTSNEYKFVKRRPHYGGTVSVVHALGLTEARAD